MAAQLDWRRWVWGFGLGLIAIPLGLLAGLNPPLALTAAGSAAFAVLAFSDLAGAVAVYIFISFFALHPFGLHDGIARIVLVLSCFALIATGRRRKFDLVSAHPVVSGTLVAFIGWAALSVVWAESPGKALVAVEQWVMAAMLFVVVAIAVRTRDDVGQALLGFVLGAVVAAASGLVAGPAIDEGRLASNFLDPNVLAAALVSATALSFGLFAIYRSSAVRVFALSMAAFSFVALWLTGSRGGLIAFAVVLLAAVVLSGRLRPYAIAVCLFAVCASVVYFQGFASDDLRERLTAPTQGEERLEEGRVTIWQVAWRAFEDNPAHGVGAGNFRVASKHYLLQPGALADSREIIDSPAVVHNAHLEVATELGVVGWVLFMMVIGSCLGCLIAAAVAFRRIGDSGMQAASICVVLALIGTLTAYVFFSDEYSKQLWVLLGLGPALLTIARVTERSGAQPALK